MHQCLSVCLSVYVTIMDFVIHMYHYHSQTNTQEVRKKKEAEYEMLSSTVKGYAGKVMTLYT